jgi:hypothetical protein
MKLEFRRTLHKLKVPKGVANCLVIKGENVLSHTIKNNKNKVIRSYTNLTCFHLHLL